MAISLNPTYSFNTSVVYLHNGKPLFYEAIVQSDEDLEKLTLNVSYFPDYVQPQTYEIPELRAGIPVVLRSNKPAYDLQKLKNIVEEEPGQMTFTLSCKGEILYNQSFNFRWMPGNAWASGEASYFPELLVALVLPNDPVVDKVLHNAGKLLEANGKKSAWQGYIGEDKNSILNKLKAIWHTLQNYNINYALPPQGELDENTGKMQKVRIPSQIIQGGCATCLDSTLFMAAIVAQAGFHPIVILVKGHAFLGVMLKEANLNKAIVTSISYLRNLAELEELVLIETTCVTRGSNTSFDDAIDIGKNNLWNEEQPLENAFDVTLLWGQGITPLGTPRETNLPPAIDEQANTDVKLNFLPEKTIAELEAEQSLVSARKRTRMENWQLKLLDLSTRNNLLNCKIDKSQITLLLHDCAKLEDDLINGKSFKLAQVQFTYELEEAIKTQDKEKLETIICEQAKEMYKRGILSASSTSKAHNLEKSIYNLYLASRRNLEESGSNTLFIACGFLKWVRRDKGKQQMMAPLLLIPVRLTRKSVKSGFQLQTTDEETRINLTLLELLKTEYDLRISELESELPTDTSGIDVAKIFTIVRRAITDFDGWEVEPTCTLGIFSFAKYLMWKDLCERQTSLLSNPIVKHLSSEERTVFPSQVGFPNPAELDNEADAQEVYTPLSSDSSQLSAILATGRGKNFVLIGPPGTGKSQTISNMIAHCLGHGKTVLFVAEKAAALSVVYNRLKRIGLGDFCLELHSNKAIKKEVLSQFKTALNNEASSTAPCNWEQTVSNLLHVRYGLNMLPWELHRLYPDGTSLYNDICLLLEAREVAKFTPCIDDPLTLTAERKGEILALTQELTLHYKSVEALFPGVAENLATTNYSSLWEEKLATALTQYSQTAESWDTHFNKLCTELQLNPEEYRSNADSLLQLLNLAEETLGQNTTSLLPSSSKSALESLEQALEEAKAYRKHQATLSLPYPEGLEDDPSIPTLYKEWKMSQFSNIVSRFFTTRRIRKTLQMHAFSRDIPDIRRDLEALLAMRKAKNADIFKLTDLPYYRKGVHIQQEDLEKAKSIAKTLSILKGVQHLSKRYLTVEGNPMQKGSDAEYARYTLNEHNTRKSTQKATLEHLLCTHLPSEADSHEGSGKWWSDEMLKIRKQWRLITVWNECANKAKEKGCGTIVRQLTSGQISHERLEDAVRINMSRCRLFAAVDASKSLTQFDATTHEAHIENFRAKDADLLSTTGTHLQDLLRTQAKGVHQYAKELAELQHELSKQRAHKPIRKLLSLTPHVSRLLKPCMLMSPLSVAQYLTPEAEPFDVVIFDEASQIPVWDAIGAIGRGKSAVIVGDPRQMPPTSFFSRSKTNDNDEEEDLEVDLESILDECLACGIPQMNLSWHYRSKSESLIAYSNRNYYDNKLLTFPAPIAKDRALQYHYVSGVYERGNNKRYNKKEAQALVEHVLSVLRRPGFKYDELTSIGIVTFNTQQQSIIQDMLEKARAEDETLEPFFDEENAEAIFVKNLENVQGDERGVIYFSTTFGPDEKGAISMNFGPLNQTGGERRLNVAITRARAGMEVFTSLKPEDINLNRTKARGVADLRGFLECAKVERQRISTGQRPLNLNQRKVYNVPSALHFRPEVGTVLAT